MKKADIALLVVAIIIVVWACSTTSISEIIEKDNASFKGPQQEMLENSK